MARSKSSELSLALSSAVSELVASVSRLVDAVRAQSAAPAAGRGVSVAPSSGPKPRGPGKNNPKLKAAIKASWERYTPAQRAARIAKMLAGRGLKPAKAAKAAAKPAKKSKKG